MMRRFAEYERYQQSCKLLQPSDSDKHLQQSAINNKVVYIIVIKVLQGMETQMYMHTYSDKRIQCFLFDSRLAFVQKKKK